MGKIHESHIHPVDVHAGAKVRTLRKSLGVSQQRLAAAVGVTFQQIQKYERGANRISCSALVKIATALETKPGWFLDDAPGAIEALPANDGWAEAQGVVATIPGAVEALICLRLMPREVRGRIVDLMQIAAGRFRLGGDDTAAAA